MATISKMQSYFSFKEGVVRQEIIKIRHKPEPRNLAGWWVLSVCLLGNTFLCLWTNMEQCPSVFHTPRCSICVPFPCEESELRKLVSPWVTWPTTMTQWSYPFYSGQSAKVTCDLSEVDGISLWDIWNWILFNKFSLSWPLKTQFQRIPVLVDALLLDEQWGSRTIVKAIVILSFCSGLSLESTEIWILEELLIQFHTKQLYSTAYSMYHCNNSLCPINRYKKLLQYKDHWWVYHIVIYFSKQRYAVLVHYI